jgi:hypothetical protein
MTELMEQVGLDQLAGAKPGPALLHEMTIWFDAYQHWMLRVTDAVADGKIPSSLFFPPEAFPAPNRITDPGRCRCRSVTGVRAKRRQHRRPVRHRFRFPARRTEGMGRATGRAGDR